MPQIFPPSANAFFRTALVSLLVGPLLVGGWVGYSLAKSPWVTYQGMVREQVVPFSHEHHVAGLGIDCRFCHTSVENSPFAGMPPTKTCMTCHSQIWTDARLLEPVRQSWAQNRPLVWQRVHDLPDFVYFDHSIHVQKGVGCSTCHGRVDQMPLLYRDQSLLMEWCLDCHRRPAGHLRPREQVFNMDWFPPADQAVAGQKLLAAYHIQTSQLTNCSICHR